VYKATKLNQNKMPVQLRYT